MVDIHVSAAYSLTQPVKLGDEMICKYHPLTSKACRLDVQPAKRSLIGIPSLAVANLLALAVKIKSKSWICVNLFYLLEYIRRNVGGHAVAEYS